MWPDLSALLYYRNTPHSITGIAPAVALNNRNYVTVRERVNPMYNPSIKDKDKIVPLFNIRDNVLALNLRSGPRWYDATITHKIGENIYSVLIHDLDVIWRRHVHQLLRKTVKHDTAISVPVNNDPVMSEATDFPVTQGKCLINSKHNIANKNNTDTNNDEIVDDNVLPVPNDNMEIVSAPPIVDITPSVPVASSSSLRRSTRTKLPVERFIAGRN